MTVAVRRLTISDLCYFKEHIRSLDKLEYNLQSEQRFEDMNVSELKQAYCMYDTTDDSVYCIGGVDGVVIWMLCTTKVEEKPLSFLKGCKKFYNVLIKNGIIYTNFAWTYNKLHIKWLKWLGAVFLPNTMKGSQQFVIFNKKKG